MELRVVPELGDRGFKCRFLLAGDVQRVAERGDVRRPGAASQFARELGELRRRPRYLPGRELEEMKHLVGRAGGGQLAVSDVREAWAGVGLVTVIRGNRH